MAIRVTFSPPRVRVEVDVVSADEAFRKKLRISKTASNQTIHLMIDSTGLRIHVGTVRKPPKQRAWRKLYIAVDCMTGDIVASELRPF